MQHNTPVLETRPRRTRLALALVLIVTILISTLSTSAGAQTDEASQNGGETETLFVQGSTDGVQPESAGQPGGEVLPPAAEAPAEQPGAAPDATISEDGEVE